jgi:hypothetical protein
LEDAAETLGLVVRDTTYEVDVVVKDGTLDDKVLSVGRLVGVVVTTGISVDLVKTEGGVVTGGSVVIGPAAVAGGTLTGEACDTVVTADKATETAGEAEVTVGEDVVLAGEVVVTADEAAVTAGDSVVTDGDSMSTADRSPLMRVAAGPRRCSDRGFSTSGPGAAKPEVTAGAAEPEVTTGAAEPEVTSGAAEPEVTSGAAEPEITSGAARRCRVESDICSTWS